MAKQVLDLCHSVVLWTLELICVKAFMCTQNTDQSISCEGYNSHMNHTLNTCRPHEISSNIKNKHYIYDIYERSHTSVVLWRYYIQQGLNNI